MRVSAIYGSWSGAHYIPALGFAELTSLEARDFDPETGTVFIAKAKSGNPRRIYLNEEGVAAFDELTAGRVAEGRIFTHSDGSEWYPNTQQRRMREACKNATIKPRIVFHELRHTYASLYLMAGGGLPDLAAQLGHTTTRMVEKHYGHLADTWRAERARKFAPKLDVGRRAKVRRLKENRQP